MQTTEELPHNKDKALQKNPIYNAHGFNATIVIMLINDTLMRVLRSLSWQMFTLLTAFPIVTLLLQKHVCPIKGQSY